MAAARPDSSDHTKETGDVNKHLVETIATHFDPQWGAPYWLEVVPSLPFNPQRDVQSLQDLSRFPPFDLDQLAARPVEHFIPRRFHSDRRHIITAETGGATGPPKRTAYLRSDFQAAFVEPFVAAASLMHFPREQQWLFVGPSGPHIIGKAARACAAAMDSMDPFSVDFDPRWFRKLAAGSMGRARYLEHVLEQALRVLDTQNIGVLFSTPPVLEALGARLTATRRERITGLHLGGMAATPEFWTRLTTDWFPNAIALSGYGNTLAGVCPQVAPCENGLPVYAPHGNRIHFDIASDGDSERGKVCFHRMDAGCFLPNVLEADEASTANISSTAQAAGFHSTGLHDPRPAAQHTETRNSGLY